MQPRFPALMLDPNPNLTRPQVLGTAKNAIVVWIGIVFLGETVTVLQGAGYAISLGGFAAYNYLKMQPDASGADPDHSYSPT